jgi:prolyl 4-hydroxylase
MQGLGVRPRKGDALLFWSIRPDGIFDPLTRHASCPVVKGQKVVATRWWVDQLVAL